MLPSAERLLEGLPFFLHRHGLDVRFNRTLLVDALAHAELLAAGDERAEPAALFFACARGPRAFGRAAQLVIPFLALGQARAIGLELQVDPDDIQLILMRLRIVRGEIGFDELRAWFASHMEPLR